MSVDLFGFVLVQANESVQNVVASRWVIVALFVVWKIIFHRANREFLLEAINFVEKKNDGCLNEPSGITDRVEEGQGFLHAIDGFIFEKELVVL